MKFRKKEKAPMFIRQADETFSNTELIDKMTIQFARLFDKRASKHT